MTIDNFNAGAYDGDVIATASEWLAKFAPEVKREEGDYVQDGVLYCGICRTPKQHDFYGNGQLIGIPCACREVEAEKRRQEQGAEDRAQRIERARAASLKAPAYMKMLFSNDDKHDVKISYLCRRYANNFPEILRAGSGLIFLGGVGSGKMFYAFAIANYVIDGEYSVFAERLSNLIASLQADFGKRREVILRKISDCDLLVIDDFGTERNTDFALEAVYDVIDTRYTSRKPMIITSNLPLEQLQNPSDMKYKRICDRILEQCQPIILTGKSRREHGATQTYEALKKILGS